MSMTVRTALQMLYLIFAYLCVTAIFPHFVVGKTLKLKNKYERFLVYTVLGNFYVMYVVFALQLLKISYPITVYLFTVVPCLLIKIKLEKIPVTEMFGGFFHTIKMFVGGQLKLRAYRDLRKPVWKERRRKLGKHIYNVYIKNLPDAILLVLLVVAVFWIYGSGHLIYFGYKASDMIVHNYWINNLSENKIFFTGVYPYGYHVAVYFLHVFFRIDTYVLLRLLAFIQPAWSIFMMLCFLRLLCKTKYMPYIGAFMYTISSLFTVNTYSRYSAPLPQEYGIMFILPAVYAGFAFFREQRIEKRFAVSKRSFVYLVVFAMSFAMTITVHFYGAMIAGLYCVGMAIAYIPWIFRKPYFGKVAITCIISVFVAVLPMGIAYATGTPLQESLAWGMSVIEGDEPKNEGEESTEESTEEGDGEELTEESEYEDPELEEGALIGRDGQLLIHSVSEDENADTDTDASIDADEEASLDSDTAVSASSSSSSSASASTSTSTSTSTGTSTSVDSREASRLEEAYGRVATRYFNNRYGKILGRIMYRADRFRNHILLSVMSDINGNNTYVFVVVFYTPILIAVGLTIMIIKKKDEMYGGVLIATGIIMLLMNIVLASKELGIPSLMDPNRCSVYFAYIIAVATPLVADGIVYLFLDWDLKKRIINAVSLVLTVAFLVSLFRYNLIRERFNEPGMELNESIICLTDIIHSNKNFTWTIVSANDENRMVYDKGFHYELVNFIWGMEHIGAKGRVQIPTETVFVFIEKIPVDYFRSYWGSGQTISEEGCLHRLPNNKGLQCYQGEHRWIVMSRAYFWAQKFMELYPNEMSVYYETDNFICYKIKQNPYRLFNFAIDYDYNLREYAKEIEDWSEEEE